MSGVRERVVSKRLVLADVSLYRNRNEGTKNGTTGRGCKQWNDGAKNRNKGTFAKTTLLQNRPLASSREWGRKLALRTKLEPTFITTVYRPSEFEESYRLCANFTWEHLYVRSGQELHSWRHPALAHQNRTIAETASDFRVDWAKSPEIPQKEGVLGAEIAARNRKSLATFHRTLKSQCSIAFSCFGNRCDFWGPRWASQSQIAKIAAISVR